MKFDYEAKLPPCHHWVQPSGTMTDYQEEFVTSCLPPPRQSAGAADGYDRLFWLSVTVPPGQARWWA